MSPKSFGKSNIYSSLAHYTDALFYTCLKIFGIICFASISLYRDRSSFLTQIIAFMQPKNN